MRQEIIQRQQSEVYINVFKFQFGKNQHFQLQGPTTNIA